jgi:hypothetical protein
MNAQAIAQVLADNVIVTPNTGNAQSAVNKAVAALRDKVERKLQELETRVVNGSGVKPKWAGVIDNFRDRQYDILPQFQVQVVKWSDLVRGKTRRVEYKTGQIAKTHDSSGEMSRALSDLHSQYPKDKDVSRNGQVGKLVNKYFTELFISNGAPLRPMGRLLEALDRQYFGRYAVTLSLDYYYTRPLTALGLHKDTTGNTIFVGLHYNNPATIVGPEYMYDFWPQFDQRAYSPHHRGLPGGADDGVYFWPKRLRDGLELARQALRDDNQGEKDLLRVSTLPANGLVAFVDELLFHQTPLTRSRKSGDEGKFSDVVFNQHTIRLADVLGEDENNQPRRLRRQFSISNMEEYWQNRATSGGGRRSFVRFWAMLEPVQWFT